MSQIKTNFHCAIKSHLCHVFSRSLARRLFADSLVRAKVSGDRRLIDSLSVLVRPQSSLRGCSISGEALAESGS